MGCRIGDNLRRCGDYHLRHVEKGERGLANLADRSIEAEPLAEAIAQCDAVILAVPDVRIGSVARQADPHLEPGTLVIGLDPAAAHAGVLPEREDLSYFVSHPCHPLLFGQDDSPRGDRDWFGGDPAAQSIVNALYQGPEEHYALGESIAKRMYAPVLRSHRITVEQMALLEPGVVETLMATCITVMKEGMDLAIARGVPEAAARDFCLGHIRTELAIIFGFAEFPFSDGAKLAIEEAKPRIFGPDWQQVLEKESIKQSVRRITGGLSET